MNTEIFTQAQRVLASILAMMGFDVNLELTILDETSCNINIVCTKKEDVAHLIGKGEQTLESLEYIFWHLFQKNLPKNNLKYRVYIDIDNIRKSKNDLILKEARTIAESVTKTGKTIRLPAMNSHRRWLIHNMISTEFPMLSTHSMGVGERRSVEIEVKIN